MAAILKVVDGTEGDLAAVGDELFSVAAVLDATPAVRRILTDHARRRGYRKHGGGARRVAVDLDAVPDAGATRYGEIVAVDEALTELEAVDPDLARIVELRFFGGFEHDEIADLLGVSNVTVRRRFRLAKAWLFRRLGAKEAGLEA